MNCCCCDGEMIKKNINNVWHCLDCGHIFRDWNGDPIDFHSEDYRKGSNSQRDNNEWVDGKVTEAFHKARKDIVERRVDAIKRFVCVGAKCIDVGSGAGTFAKELADRCSIESIECMELDLALVEESRRLGFKTYNFPLEMFECNEVYEAVFAWHVLEHVPNPANFLNKALELVSDDKYLIIEVPTLISLSGKGRRRKLIDPNSQVFDGHYHYFNKESLTELVESVGGEIVQIREGIQSPAILAVITK